MESKMTWIKFNDRHKLCVKKDQIQGFYTIEGDFYDDNRMEIILYVPGNQIQLLYNDIECFRTDLERLKEEYNG